MMHKPGILFTLFLLWQTSASQAQTPIITPLALPAADTLDALPGAPPMRWVVKADGQYYLPYNDEYVGLQRDTAAAAAWHPVQLPAFFYNPLVEIAQAAGNVYLSTTVRDIAPGNGFIDREFSIVRSVGTWSNSSTVFYQVYHVNTVVSTPFQVPDYRTKLDRLNDSVFYYHIFLLGQNGAASTEIILYSTDTGVSWQLASTGGDFVAHDFFALRDGYFLRADNAGFTNAVEWPFPDSTLKKEDIRGLFWEAGTFYLYTQTGIRWHKTDSSNWEAEQLPVCGIQDMQQKQQRCYARTGDGLYAVVHTQTNWKQLQAAYAPKPPYYVRDFLVVDSLDLLFFSSTPGLLHSTDGGTTWQPFHRGLSYQGTQNLGFWGDSLLSSRPGILDISAEGRGWRPKLIEPAICSNNSWYPVGQGGFVLSIDVESGSPPQYHYQVFYTPDRTTWIPAAPVPDDINYAFLYYQQQRLWLLGIERCTYSDDLGQHWDTLNLPNATSHPEPYRGWATQGDTIVFVNRDGQCLRTTDLGQNWVILPTPVLSNPYPSNWIFRQQQQLVFCSNGGRLWRSADWGDTWTQTCSGLPGYTEEALGYTLKHDSVLVTDNYLTLDAGQHWTKLTGAPVPVPGENMVWNDTWLYFSHYLEGIYRVPAGPLLYRLQHPDGSVSTQDPSLTKTWTIQPNPVQQQLYIAGTVPDAATWSIVDISGRAVLTGIWQGQPIAVRTLIAGVYFLKIQAGAGVHTQKFIVNN